MACSVSSSRLSVLIVGRGTEDLTDYLEQSNKYPVEFWNYHLEITTTPFPRMYFHTISLCISPDDFRFILFYQLHLQDSTRQ